MRAAWVWILLVMGGLVLGWWLGRQQGAPAADASASTATTPVLAANGAGGAAASPRGAPPGPSAIRSGASAPAQPAPAIPAATEMPLPPANTPLAGIIGDLERRASAGDAPAAMRLYRELERCRMQRAVGQFSAMERRRMVSQAMSPDQFQRIARAQAQRQVQSCFGQHICAGITPAQDASSANWLVQSATLGDLDARASFATGGFINNGDLDALQHVPLFRSQAVAWAQQAADAGRIEALTALGRAYASADFGFQSPLAQLVAQDTVRGASYLHAAALVRRGGRRGTEEPLQDLELLAGVELSGPERAAAITDGETFYQRHLRGVPPDSEVAVMNLNPTPADLARLAPQCLVAEPAP